MVLGGMMRVILTHEEIIPILTEAMNSKTAYQPTIDTPNTHFKVYYSGGDEVIDVETIEFIGEE